MKVQAGLLSMLASLETLVVRVWLVQAPLSETLLVPQPVVWLELEPMQAPMQVPAIQAPLHETLLVPHLVVWLELGPMQAPKQVVV